MPIKLYCECGKQLTLKEELAGKKIRCPGCQATLVVPAEADAAYGMTGAPAPVEEDWGEEVDRPRPRKKKRKKAAPGGGPPVRLLLLIGGGVLAFLLCLGCGFAGWNYVFNSPGNDLVGTWETDTTQGQVNYGQVRFTSFGQVTITVAKSALPTQTGNWRFLKKVDDTYHVEITDAKGKYQAEITMREKNRMTFALAQPHLRLELKRME